MAVKITSSFNMPIEQFYATAESILEEEISRAFQYLGEQCEKKTRDRAQEDSWNDQTGNLRSSIGYSLYVHGVERMTSAFKQIKKGTEGTTTGRNLAQELARRHAKDFALVVVAGMDYASDVEDMEGKDVLATTTLWAQGKVDEYVDKAIDKATRRINKL